MPRVPDVDTDGTPAMGAVSRRGFLATLGVLPALALVPGRSRGEPAAPRPAPGWRVFHLTTDVEVLRPAGVTRAWIPIPAFSADWQRPGKTEWTGNATSVRLVGDVRDGAPMVAAEWRREAAAPRLTVHSAVAVRERPPASTRRRADPLDRKTRERFTTATRWIPTRGVVAETAAGLTRGATTDLDKARAIYEWVVQHAYRDPATRGCGDGDVKAMLARKALGGKCADINALYVALARSVGLPARDLYGIRVAESRLGYRSLGCASPTVTRAQHCRAEVFVREGGWMPVDPADVRKVMLEEKAAPTTLDDPLVRAARSRLLGSWEMNWVAYNCAHDVYLPGASGSPLAFFMYPQAETEMGRLDCLDPDNFKYSITATAA